MIIMHNNYEVQTEIPEVAFTLGFNLANRTEIDWWEYEQNGKFETLSGKTFTIKSIDHKRLSVLITK